uniref:PKcGMP_CC domain-containing protein n=1 Tax=Globodera pallida TaxID=36090 RepID=A0A183CJQ2_GLOPA
MELELMKVKEEMNAKFELEKKALCAELEQLQLNIKALCAELEQLQLNIVYLQKNNDFFWFGSGISLCITERLSGADDQGEALV